MRYSFVYSKFKYRQHSKFKNFVCARVNSKSRYLQKYYESIIQEQSQIFTGIGCLKEEPYHVVLEPGAQPKVQPIRKVGLPLQNDLKQALAELEMQKIIVKVQVRVAKCLGPSKKT